MAVLVRQAKYVYNRLYCPPRNGLAADPPPCCPTRFFLPRRWRPLPMRGIYLAVAFFPGVSLAGPAAPAAETVNYVRDIKPLLSTRCYACHGALRQKSNLRLDTAALIRKGGRHGPAIVAGQGVQSLLIAAVTGNNRPRMPPASEGAPLTEKQVGLLKAWIDQGACAPDEPTPEDPCKHWAFQRPVRSAVPRVANPSWGRNPIDAFIAAEHAKRGLQPSPPAARETLLRR